MSDAPRHAFFDSAVGKCALAWNDVGLTGVWLPDVRPGALRRKVAHHLGQEDDAAPSPPIGAIVDAIRRLLAGARVDLRDVPLDLASIDDFRRRVYAVTRTIAAGRVLTYGAVAGQVGADASARAVGQALGANPFPIVVPCHRVVATSGGLGGFSAPGGVAMKRRLLAIEDARLDGAPDLFDEPPTRSGVASRRAPAFRSQSPRAAPTPRPRRPSP
jgi:methylated-DNA-[protein]-cysteine S-methyltransferase